MTRKKGLVWKHFSEILTAKNKQGQCKYCGDKHVSNVARMEKHLIKCKSAPFQVKEQFSSQGGKKMVTHKHKRQVSEPVPSTSNQNFSSNIDSDDFQDDKSCESSDTDAAVVTYNNPNHESHKHTATMALASSSHMQKKFSLLQITVPYHWFY